VLAFGLSFGFGTRDVVRNVTAGFYVRKILVIGKAPEINGQKGVLQGITAPHVVLNTDCQETLVANATLLDHVAKH
jgi:hypothetical protein